MGGQENKTGSHSMTTKQLFADDTTWLSLVPFVVIEHESHRI
jgi:hypothetical protein